MRVLSALLSLAAAGCGSEAGAPPPPGPPTTFLRLRLTDEPLSDEDPRAVLARDTFRERHGALQALRTLIPEDAEETELSSDLIEQLRAAGYLEDD